MEIIITPDADAASRLAGSILKKEVARKPKLVLGLATGETMKPVYRELVRLNLDFRQATAFNLDEYVGLGSDDAASYAHFLNKHFLQYVNLPPTGTHLLDGRATPVEYCLTYEQRIVRAEGIDVQLLGVSRAGHLGFNEPTSSLRSRTRIKTLTDASVEVSREWFPPSQPIGRHVLTMGIGTILEARTCLLLAFGSHKAHAIQQAVEGPLTAFVPASALQLHPRTIVIVDEAAAEHLRMASYYRYVYDHKPAWQRDE